MANPAIWIKPRSLFAQEAGRTVKTSKLGWRLNRDFYGLTSSSEADFDNYSHAVFILPENPVRAGFSYLVQNPVTVAAATCANSIAFPNP